MSQIHRFRVASIAAVLLCLTVGYVLQAPPDSHAFKKSHPTPSGGASLLPEVDKLLAEPASRQGGPGATKSLNQLKAALLAMPPKEALRWINQRFASGEDFTTGLDITIGQDGALTAWPALRVFLLDVLFAVEPAASADLGRKILRSPTTADEWALALRNVAEGSPSAEDDALLKAKSAEMLHNETWRKEASAGYLQAFDVIVHTRNTALAPELIQYSGDTGNKAVRHAAFLTLDRLTLAEPAAMLEKLIPSAAAQPATALMVSNMVARADVRDPAQRRLVEDYLLDEKRTGAEIQAFTGVFPNASQFVSPNLLTKSAAVPRSELTVRDHGALEVVSAWLDDPRFSRVHASLRGTAERLKSFVSP